MAATARSLTSVLSTNVSRLRDRAQPLASTLQQHVAVSSDYLQSKWAVYRPTTALQWLAFVGCTLLALSVVSTVLMIVASFLLVAAWVGLVMFAVTVFTCSFAAVFCGTAMLFFSATAAVMGTSILSTACGLYAAMSVLARVRDVGMRYVENIHQSTGKLQYRPQLMQHEHAVAATGTSPEPDVKHSNPLFHTDAPLPLSSSVAVPDASPVDQYRPPGTCPVKAPATTTSNGSYSSSGSAAGAKATAAAAARSSRAVATHAVGAA